MDKKEFSRARHYLGKTQNELAKLICVSPKAIQSFEQGWREVPASAERQLLFLLSLRRAMEKTAVPCWEIRNCPMERRAKCTAWEFKAGSFCWFVNGTMCEGEVQEDWEKKILICRQCEVFRLLFPLL